MAETSPSGWAIDTRHSRNLRYKSPLHCTNTQIHIPRIYQGLGRRSIKANIFPSWMVDMPLPSKYTKCWIFMQDHGSKSSGYDVMPPGLGLSPRTESQMIITLVAVLGYRRAKVGGLGVQQGDTVCVKIRYDCFKARCADCWLSRQRKIARNKMKILIESAGCPLSSVKLGLTVSVQGLHLCLLQGSASDKYLQFVSVRRRKDSLPQLLGDVWCSCTMTK
ncbi:hypothetical protein Agabi119p4_3915 [Agaricus bisporus var. burnettii]|uniref:Uncharacterized protein n=1 Tax=Agaricus bisporus var. burnettii TaxID=192524 RepID=A0A8H7F5L3_AGABI|nr:hypothetical protein Agabi119p4_3915 [Agaricus bisporus var. burnettii]